MANPDNITIPGNVVRFPESGGTNVYPDGSGVGLELYVAGIFAGLIRLHGDAVIAYGNDFGPLGAFQSIDQAARAVCSELTH